MCRTIRIHVSKGRDHFKGDSVLMFRQELLEVKWLDLTSCQIILMTTMGRIFRKYFTWPVSWGAYFQWIVLQNDGCSTHWKFSQGIFWCRFPQFLDWKEWPDSMACTFSRLNSVEFLHLGTGESTRLCYRNWNQRRFGPANPNGFRSY